MATSSMSTRAAAEIASRPEIDNLPTLLSRLGDDVTEFFDTKFSLLKVELSEEANTFIRAGTAIAVSAVVAAIGFALLNVAIALGISALFANTNLPPSGRYALGFVITGIPYLVIGSIIAMAIKGRLAQQKLVPNATIEELRRDAQWLKKEF